LAEFDSAVEKQTRKLGKPGRPKPAPAVPATPEERNRLPPPSPAAPAPSAPPPPPETTALPPPEPPPVAPAEPLGPGSLALPELAVPSLVPPAPSPRRERALALPPGPLSPRVGSYEELLPPLFGPAGPAVPDGPVGDLGSDDYLPDLPEGDRLSLNAREFKYWSFFQRVRENLRQHWRPGDKFQRRDPWGKVYGVKDRLTVLSVTLDPSGKIQELTLVKPSGVDFLDDEALDAFRAAARFPNPPPGLVEADGLIRFTFGFAVVRNTGDFQLFRYRF
ncbi:MAG: energy transducer TonB, partial [Myxococcota bacterium]|nr:energy transducer TonB [Myxococcota bacterium]